MQSSRSVDQFLEANPEWGAELETLRKLLLASGLEETVKWGGPCYVAHGQNVVGLGAFKSYVGLWFFQGALLEDARGVLINAQKGRTQAMRQWRFASAGDIQPRIVKSYIKDAMQLAEQGKSVKPRRTKPLVVPDELQAALAKDKTAANRFAEFGRSKQREYAEYITDAKRAETKDKRLKKILPMIRDGVGLNDRYR